MSIKKKIMAGAISTVSLFLLAACGDSASDQSNGSGDGTEQITLEFMFRGGPDEREAYETAIASFEEENPGVKVNIVATDADQYATQLQAAISGNDIPDVFYIEQGDVMAYADNGILLDINEYVENSDVDFEDIWEYGVDSYRYDGDQIGEGTLYGLPKDVGPFALAYNKTMFEESGVDLPDLDEPYTWDEFIEVGKELTKEDQWATGFNVNWALHAFVWSNGADYLNDDLTEVTVNTPEFAEALQYFADLQNVHGLTPSIEQAQTLDTYQRWMSGEIAFFPAGPWDMSTFNELDFEYDLIPWPAGSTGESATYIGSLGISVSADTKYPEESVELAMYLSADPDGQQQLIDANVQIPNSISVAEEWALDTESVPNNKQEFLDIVGDYGRALPGAKTYTSEWYDELFINIQPVLDGDITAAEYLEQIEPRMQEFLDQSIQQHEVSKGN